MYVRMYVCMHAGIHECIHKCMKTSASVFGQYIAIETCQAHITIEAGGVILAVEALTRCHVAGRAQLGIHVAIAFTLVTLATL